MKELEKILKALANRRRLAILRYLKSIPEASVGEIANEIKLSFKSTSKHLGILTAVDVIDHDQRGLQIFHRLAFNSKQPIKQIIAIL